jgi:ABC-2 type transport system permease protein
LVFYLLAPFVGIAVGIKSAAATLGALLLLALALSSLGFLVAWHMRSTQGFHAVMNLVLVPLLILSGAFFPVDGAAAWLRAAVMVNPLTYGVSLLRSAVHAQTLTAASGGPAGLVVSLAVSFVFAVALLALATRAAARQTSQVFE